MRDRSDARALLALQLAEQTRQVEAARRRLATGRPMKLSDLRELDVHAFGLFLGLLGEALGEQSGPDFAVQRRTGDGLLNIKLEPLDADSHAKIVTPRGSFAGRDHRITITPTRDSR